MPIRRLYVYAYFFAICFASVIVIDYKTIYPANAPVTFVSIAGEFIQAKWMVYFEIIVFEQFMIRFRKPHFALGVIFVTIMHAFFTWAYNLFLQIVINT